MEKHIIKHIAGLVLLLTIGFTTIYQLEIIKQTSIESTSSDYHNYGDTRILKASEYRAEAIYSEIGELECWYIYFDNIYGRRIIECVDDKGISATEWKDSYLLPFLNADGVNP